MILEEFSSIRGMSGPLFAEGFWGKSIPCRENSQSKGPGVGIGVAACCQKSKATVAVSEEAEGRTPDMRSTREGKGADCEGPQGRRHHLVLAFTLSGSELLQGLGKG